MLSAHLTCIANRDHDNEPSGGEVRVAVGGIDSHLLTLERRREVVGRNVRLELEAECYRLDPVALRRNAKVREEEGLLASDVQKWMVSNIGLGTEMNSVVIPRRVESESPCQRPLLGDMLMTNGIEN